MDHILRDENKQPILFKGKEMTLDDFKRCIGRMDEAWLKYMDLVLAKRREKKLMINNTFI